MDYIYNKAVKIWNGLDGFRSARNRCKRYVYGEQWDDTINLGSHTITEHEFIIRQGQVPLKNNILRRILRNVIGLYRSQHNVPMLAAKDSGLTAAEVRAENRRRRRWFHENSMGELAPRLLEEFLISGLVAVKIIDGKVHTVTPDNFFFHSDGYDPRGNDIDMVGEVHRVSLSSLFSAFCHDAEDYRRISALYRGVNTHDGCYTITEVWHKDTQVYGMLHDEQSATLSICHIDDILAAMPGERIAAGVARKVKSLVKTRWRQLWFAHDGTLLREGEPKEMYPYAFKVYPFIDGEVHSYIGDLIDQQRYVNRLITLYDFIMKSSAKGVLLFPDESIPTGMDLQDVANEWSRFNGVIPYRAKPGLPMPTQVSGKAENIGITDLLKIEMQMLEDISGVSPTLQGKLETNSTSGTLFAQQNEAAQTSLLDVIRSFTDFLDGMARKGTFF